MKEYDKKYEEIITKCVEDSDNHKIVKNVKRMDFYNLKEGNGFIQFLIDNRKEFKHYLLFEIEIIDNPIIYMWYEKGTGNFMLLDIKQINSKFKS